MEPEGRHLSNVSDSEREPSEPSDRRSRESERQRTAWTTTEYSA